MCIRTARAENRTEKSRPIPVLFAFLNRPYSYSPKKKQGTGNRNCLTRSGTKTVEAASPPYLRYPVLGRDIPVFYPVLRLSDFSPWSSAVGPKQKLICTELR
jgi:hypothetical protein